jgi:hypothetical protein
MRNEINKPNGNNAANILRQCLSQVQAEIDRLSPALRYMKPYRDRGWSYRNMKSLWNAAAVLERATQYAEGTISERQIWEAWAIERGE